MTDSGPASRRSRRQQQPATSTAPPSGFGGSGPGPLRGIARLRNARSGRRSSWDRTGGNRDYIRINPGETATIVDVVGAGCLTHLWFTVWSSDSLWPRKLVLRAFWDGEGSPSVLSPFGDFFALGHAIVRPFVSLPLTVVAGRGEQSGRAGFNCFLPMPFGESARLELVNEAEKPIEYLFFNVDFERYDRLDEPLGRFHASWRCERPTAGYGIKTHAEHLSTPNLDGNQNYLVVDARGRGHYVGTVLSIDNLDIVPDMTWWGEGDEMVFVDGDAWPPSLHGTGTEDYFNSAWSFPSGEYSAPYHGLTIAGDVRDWSGKWSAYRFHIEDPILFERSLRFTIEHGHANWQSNDYSSVAYWYQAEPHAPLPPLGPVSSRLPLPELESRSRFNQNLARE